VGPIEDFRPWASQALTHSSTVEYTWAPGARSQRG